MARTPKVGQWADHKSGSLDPRPVAEVSEDGKQIRLLFWGNPSEQWFPAKNYTYTEA